MAEDISVQILAQTSENIQKLFDLSTRIDERVKAIQTTQAQLEHRIEDVIQRQHMFMQRVAVIEARDSNDYLKESIKECEEEMGEMDKRLSVLEKDSGRSQERWKGIASFVVQLVWVILAAYMLTKMNLQPPAVP